VGGSSRSRIRPEYPTKEIPGIHGKDKFGVLVDIVLVGKLVEYLPIWKVGHMGIDIDGVNTYDNFEFIEIFDENNLFGAKGD
jgi:hypothetical protein